jgi:hypothetical protein
MRGLADIKLMAQRIKRRTRDPEVLDLCEAVEGLSATENATATATEKRKRGRPRSATALSSTERSRRYRERHRAEAAV